MRKLSLALLFVILVFPVLVGCTTRKDASPETRKDEESASGPSSNSIAIGDGREASFEIPEGHSVSRSNASTIKIEAEGGVFLISAFTLDGEQIDDAWVKDTLTGSGTELLSTSVETELDIQKFTGIDVEGYMFSLTDKSLVGVTPTAGDYKYVTFVYAYEGNVYFSATLLGNDANGSLREQGLAILRSTEISAQE